MNELTKKNIGDIVALDYRTAQVFHNYRIDFCCRGNRKLEDVCAEKSINVKHILDDLNQTISQNTQEVEDYSSWPLDHLIDLIIKKHHAYVERQIPVLLQFLNKLSKVHGPNHVELIEIEGLFRLSAAELTKHMKKEEFVLFPFIQKMVAAEKTGKSIEPIMFGSVKSPVRMMMEDHENEGARFQLIHDLSKGYTVPEDGCNTYATTYALLNDFEQDLHRHIHLENNIVFPRAVELEEKMIINSPSI